MNAQNKKELKVEEWFAKAQDDELSIGAIIKEKASSSNACFLSQQIGREIFESIAYLSPKEFSEDS